MGCKICRTYFGHHMSTPPFGEEYVELREKDRAEREAYYEAHKNHLDEFYSSEEIAYAIDAVKKFLSGTSVDPEMVIESKNHDDVLNQASKAFAAEINVQYEEK